MALLPVHGVVLAAASVAATAAPVDVGGAAVRTVWPSAALREWKDGATMIHMALLIVALVLFLIAACGVNTGRCNLVALGLFFWVLSILIQPR